MVNAMRLFSTLAAFILFVLPLDADEYYLLPAQKSDLLHTLKMKIERAQNITIITGKLESQTLLRSIEKALTRGIKFHLITGSLESAAFYAKYKNTNVKVPVSTQTADSFALNILLIDKSDVCFSSVAFSESDLTSVIGQVICTTDKEDILFAQNVEKYFSDRFENYHQ